MPHDLTRRAAIGALAAGAGALASEARIGRGKARRDEGEIRVATFNIRLGTARDGDDAWGNRRGRVFEMIERLDADVLGLQEALRFQLDEILEAAPQYGEIGVGRQDGVAAGEYSSVLFRTDRFGVGAAGTFWLSDTPRTPGSASWGNAIPRICTWGRLIDIAPTRAFWVFNTHWDHMSQPSRERSAEAVIQAAHGQAGGEPAVVMGDLNAGEDNPAYRRLRDDPLLVDAFRSTNPQAERAGTFSGFRLDYAGEGARIDHVLVSPGWRVLSSEIHNEKIDGRWASDHHPVSATLGWSEDAPGG